MIANITPSLIILGGAVVAAVVVACASGMPRPQQQPQQHEAYPLLLNQCNTNEKTNELCQRCAAKSKSYMVYPMCCTSQEEAWEWCYAYVNYGLLERHLFS